MRRHTRCITVTLNATFNDGVLCSISIDRIVCRLMPIIAASPVAVLLPRLFGSVFNGFHANASSIFMGAPAVLTIVAIAATCIPAYRATQLDPMAALRQE
jgi:ABC-type lipoprotein release transport system permease subunit